MTQDVCGSCGEAYEAATYMLPCAKGCCRYRDSSRERDLATPPSGFADASGWTTGGRKRKGFPHRDIPAHICRDSWCFSSYLATIVDMYQWGYLTGTPLDAIINDFYRDTHAKRGWHQDRTWSTGYSIYELLKRYVKQEFWSVHSRKAFHPIRRALNIPNMIHF